MLDAWISTRSCRRKPRQEEHRRQPLGGGGRQGGERGGEGQRQQWQGQLQGRQCLKHQQHDLHVRLQHCVSVLGSHEHVCQAYQY